LTGEVAYDVPQGVSSLTLWVGDPNTNSYVEFVVPLTQR
jgi:hypothetical protein